MKEKGPFLYEKYRYVTINQNIQTEGSELMSAQRKKSLLMLTVIFLVALLIFVIGIRNQQLGKVKYDGGENTQIEEDIVLTSLSPTDKPMTTAVPEDLPDIDIKSWEYVLANKANTYDLLPQVAPIQGEIDRYFDSRAVDSLNQMLSDMRAAGYTFHVNMAYVPYSYQELMYEKKVKELAGDEEISEKYENQAERIVPRAGQSDHQTALGVDITDGYFTPYTNEELSTEKYVWLRDHCAQYGFIQRYPDGKQGITGYRQLYSFRYVGKTAAEYIQKYKLCLEEFIQLYKNKEAAENDKNSKK